MSYLVSSMKRTCTALVFGVARHCCGFSSRPAMGVGVGVGVGILDQHFVRRGISGPLVPIIAASSSTSTFRTSTTTSTVRYLSTNFQAPEPPQSKGQAVYKDIDFSNIGSTAIGDESLSSSLSSHAALRNSDPNAVFVVSGASRGIGLEFVKALLKRTKGTVIACCRTPESSSGLQEILSSSLASSSSSSSFGNRLKVIQLDIENQTSIETAVGEIKKQFQRVDMLLNVAGILGDGKTTPGPERTIAKIDREWMEKTFAVNVVGPVMLSKELAPLMAQKRRVRKKQDDANSNNDDDQRPNAIIANLSARVGSISDNELGGWYSYRMSKSALNQATRTMSHELKRQSIWCISLHPGTTDTDLSKPFQKNVQEGRLFPVEFTVESLLKVIESMDETNSGGLYDWAGKSIPF